MSTTRRRTSISGRTATEGGTPRGSSGGSAGRRQQGFTLMEMLVGLAMGVAVILAFTPVWLGLERREAAWNDRLITLLQSRVAAARLERDLRLASTLDCSGLVGGPLLQCTPGAVVVVTREGASAGPEIVKWEFVDGVLMRRRLAWPGFVPDPLKNGVFLDNKTMLEGLAEAHFHCFVGAAEVPMPLAADVRDLVDLVEVEGHFAAVQPHGGGTGTTFSWRARVGR